MVNHDSKAIQYKEVTVRLYALLTKEKKEEKNYKPPNMIKQNHLSIQKQSLFPEAIFVLKWSKQNKNVATNKNIAYMNILRYADNHLDESDKTK